MKSDRVDWFTKPNVVIDGVLSHRMEYPRTQRGILAPSEALKLFRRWHAGLNLPRIP
jgi:hypothetical protein